MRKNGDIFFHDGYVCMIKDGFLYAFIDTEKTIKKLKKLGLRKQTLDILFRNRPKKKGGKK